MGLQVGNDGNPTAVRPAPPTLVAEETLPPLASDSRNTVSRASATPPPSLKPHDVEGLGTLSDGVRQVVLTYGIPDGELSSAKEAQIKNNLKIEIQRVVSGVYLLNDKGADWTIRDLTNLHSILSLMPPGDRQTLSGVSFIRSHHAKSADGASEQVRNLYGRDAAGLLEELGVGGESRDVQQISEPSKPGIWGRIKNFFVVAAESFKGILGIRLLSGGAGSEYEGKPERIVILTDTGSNLLISKRLWAHEVGHQLQLTDGMWNPEKIREFGKLSGWLEVYPGKTEQADGIDDRTGKRMLFDNDKVLRASRQDNFVSPWAKSNPTEDFAESYATYLLNPGLLIEKAPEKFLFINSQSRKYTAEQTRELASVSKTDLNKVMTSLIMVGSLQQEILTLMTTLHGLKPDRETILSQVPEMPASPLMQAWFKIVSILKTDPERHREAVENAAGLVGEPIWKTLKASEQHALSDSKFMHQMIGALGHNSASGASAIAATRLEGHREASEHALHLLLHDADFRTGLLADSPKILMESGLLDTLPSDVVKALVHKDNKPALKEMVKMLTRLSGNDKQWDQYQANLAKLASQMTPNHLEAFAESLNNQEDPDQAARILENAIKTGNLIYPGDGNAPPGP